MNVGAIDIGTNTVLLLVAERRGSTLVPVAERMQIVRLGEGVDRTRRLAPAAVERTLGALEEYAAELRSLGVERVEAVGTSALRDAEGAKEFLDAAERILGARPRVVDGPTEAALTFRGALSGLRMSGDVAVFDVGGGSTEVVVGTASAGSSPTVKAAKSLDVGSVRLFERHVTQDPASAAELARVAADVDEALAAAPVPVGAAPLVGVAGTVTTLASVALGLPEYDSERLHGLVLSRAQIDEVTQRLAALPLDQRRAVAGLSPKRADVIVVGATIVQRVLAWSGASELIVSDRGVRWGVAERLAFAGG